VATPEEQVTAKARVSPPETKDPNEIAIPKKQSVKETKKPADAVAKKPVTTDKSTDKPTTAAKKSVAKTKPSTQSGSSGTAESESAIRQRLASALAAAEGGTPGGDNRPRGGGTGESKYGRLGSPDGAADGIAGGIGKGSPFWSYYMHVHDRMYEAWEQPGQARDFDKKLVATILLRVARDGRIDAVRLEQSSGNKIMDDSALAAAHSVPRLDPLPDGLGGDFADISVNFRLEG
jgi:TonB family protein